ncbi:hypothetical protein F4778DRAFT_525423 [Xylariomycetidae sp. FL2044]|nr:hypothetical protein F4778DRAFT_525423 [Xylariomycetidae sp. FL2044]
MNRRSETRIPYSGYYEAPHRSEAPSISRTSSPFLCTQLTRKNTTHSFASCEGHNHGFPAGLTSMVPTSTNLVPRDLQRHKHPGSSRPRHPHRQAMMPSCIHHWRPNPDTHRCSMGSFPSVYAISLTSDDSGSSRFLQAISGSAGEGKAERLSEPPQFTSGRCTRALTASCTAYLSIYGQGEFEARRFIQNTCWQINLITYVLGAFT